MKSALNKVMNWEEIGERIGALVETNEKYQEPKNAAYDFLKDLELTPAQLDVIEDHIIRAEIAIEEAAYTLGFSDGGRLVAAIVTA